MWDWYVRHGMIPHTDLYYKTVSYPYFTWMCNPASFIRVSLTINEFNWYYGASDTHQGEVEINKWILLDTIDLLIFFLTFLFN